MRLGLLESVLVMQSQGDAVQEVLIVGGGTAGWMAACLLAKALTQKGVAIRLVESPEIGIVGVGEGSTPQLRAFFDQLGVPESDWMPACDATYKLGIRFNQWSDNPHYSSYFHPFPSALDAATAKSFLLSVFERRQGLPVAAHPDDWFLNTALVAEGKDHTAADVDVQYGYHFDAYKVGAYLARVAESLGVEHITGRVVSVDRTTDGDLRAVRLEDGRELEADFFVDSTGFSGLLIQKTLQVPFTAFDDNLFNDSAVVMPTPNQSPFRAQTVSTAMSCGWRWQIPLQSRIGNGYVYSSQYLDADAAETEFRSSLNMLDSEVEARHLKMRVGQLSQHWSHNCLAVGLAQGFIEPLEATALHLVQSTVELFIELLEQQHATVVAPNSESSSSDARIDFTNVTDGTRNQFNKTICQRFEGVRDYIVCHYQVNRRADSAYWRDNANNKIRSDNLSAVLDAWYRRQDLTPVLIERDMSQYYSSVSWHCLLAGYGVYPDVDQSSPEHERVAQQRLSHVRGVIRRSLSTS